MPNIAASVVRYTSAEMWLRLLAFFLVAASCGFARAPQGVPRDLARERAAQVSGVRHELSSVLTPAPAGSGHERIIFALRAARALLLDFRNGTLSLVQVNGAPVPVKQENGHLELPADRLRARERVVLADYTANVARAGKAITRYDSDNTEYLCTSFVPMDASVASPSSTSRS